MLKQPSTLILAGFAFALTAAVAFVLTTGVLSGDSGEVDSGPASAASGEQRVLFSDLGMT